MSDTQTIGIDDRSRIRDTIATYCHTLDDGRFDEFEQQFTDDAIVEVMGRTITTATAIRTWMEGVMPPERRGRHITSNTAIEILGPDRASALTDFLFYARSEGQWLPTQVGRYEDELACVDGRWRLARRVIRLGNES